MGTGQVADDAELVASELVTNAVRATAEAAPLPWPVSRPTGR